MKAVENGGTAIGIRCKDGVVLALEKLVYSKLQKKESNKRIATVDRNIGIVMTYLHDCTHAQTNNGTGIFRTPTGWQTLRLSRP